MKSPMKPALKLGLDSHKRIVLIVVLQQELTHALLAWQISICNQTQENALILVMK